MLATPKSSTCAIATALLAISLATSSPLHAEPCSRDAIRRIVDEAGARLRVITSETQPRIMASLRKLKEQRGWTGPDGDEKAAAYLSDERTVDLDRTSTTLLAQIDELGEAAAKAEPDCSRLAELEAASLELQATVKAKAQYILARLEQASGAPPSPVAAQAPPSAPPPAPAATASPLASAPPTPAAAAAEVPRPEAPLRRADAAPVGPAARQPAPPAVAAPKAKPAPASGWSTETTGSAVPSLPRPPPPSESRDLPLPPLPRETAESFSRDEIREASRGFFGTISGGLASVMEHAFSTLGTPSGYVLGNEGGGAFIAGLRYGKGTLFQRDGSKREVYWHGPSIGYDFGASGAKTMFLVYNLKNDIDIFSGFSGVEGSAYLVGGVGMTVLTDGKVVMAPIRSGLGVRLGANIGYIRFTARPTWNPF
jgi:hypothetical protein